MSKSTASAHDDDRPARPQPGAEGHGTAGAADGRAQPGSSPDPEIIELVERFEAAFADLGASAEEGPQRPGPEADLFPDFSQDIFAETPAAPSVAAESARVFPMPRRDSEPAPKQATKPARAPAASPAPADEVSLDEAFSILRASENRSAGPAPAAEAPAGSFAPQARTQTPVSERTRQPEPRAPVDAEREPESPSGGPDWTTKSHKARSIALVATAAALVIGIAVGYLYGRNPAAPAPSTGIGAAQQGGTMLRLDRELHKP
jgi:hypothetical protein